MIDDGLTPKKRAALVGDFFRRYGCAPQPVDVPRSVFEEALPSGRVNAVGRVSQPVPVLRYRSADGAEHGFVPAAFRPFLS